MSARSTPQIAKSEGIVGRRLGYTVNIVINAALLSAVNVWPGWRSLSFVTDDAELLLTLLNASLVAGIVASVICLVFDRKWVKALCDLITVGLSLVLLVQVWLVFPFAFDGAVDWATVVRVVIVVSIGGCAVAMAVQLVVFLRELFRGRLIEDA